MRIPIFNLSTLPNYSTVSFVWCNDANCYADLTYNFTITYRRPLFSIPKYSQYQFFIYETITEQREKGKTFIQIADELNRKGYLSVRGKVFKGNHVHSIVKKKRMRDERFYKKYPEEWSDISFEVVDKSLVNMFKS